MGGATVHGGGGESLRDPEHADAYGLALEFFHVASRMVERRGLGRLRAEVERAALGMAVWFAEAARSARPADRRRLLRRARASAVESAEILDVLRVRRLIDPADYVHARAKLVRLTAVLAQLAAPPH
jgi:four helix bundle protein